jgi:hypothetical protein
VTMASMPATFKSIIQYNSIRYVKIWYDILFIHIVIHSIP